MNPVFSSLVMSEFAHSLRNMNASYGVSSLASAQVDAAKYFGKHPDLAYPHSSYFVAMAKAFGIDNPGPDGTYQPRERVKDFVFRGCEPDPRDLDGLIHSTVRSLVKLDYLSPFSGYLEASEIIINYYDKYGYQICPLIDPLRKVMMDMLVEATAEFHGISPDHQVTYQDLLDNGLPPNLEWPDEFDYF